MAPSSMTRKNSTYDTCPETRGNQEEMGNSGKVWSKKSEIRVVIIHTGKQKGLLLSRGPLADVPLVRASHRKS